MLHDDAVTRLWNSIESKKQLYVWICWTNDRHYWGGRTRDYLGLCKWIDECGFYGYRIKPVEG